MFLKNQKGFTIVEFLVVMAILATLYSFITINFLNTKHRASINSFTDTLISDMKQQQLKAMIGDTEGRTYADSYGIHFSSTNYVLFHGLTYSGSDPSNFVVNLDPDINFINITFPNNQIIFASGSGEFTGYSPTTNSIIVKTIQGAEQQMITVNKYGVVISAN